MGSICEVRFAGGPPGTGTQISQRNPSSNNGGKSDFLFSFILGCFSS